MPRQWREDWDISQYHYKSMACQTAKMWKLRLLTILFPYTEATKGKLGSRWNSHPARQNVIIITAYLFHCLNSFFIYRKLEAENSERCFFLHRRTRSLIHEDYMRDRYTLFGLGWKEEELPPDGSSRCFRKFLWEAYPALKTTKSFIFCSRSLNSSKLGY